MISSDIILSFSIETRSEIIGFDPNYSVTLFKLISYDLCNIPIPDTVEGISYKNYLEGTEVVGESTLITCVQPFGQWNRYKYGGQEYRGVVTTQFTYTINLDGPWLLFDDKNDPFQKNNLVGNPEYAIQQASLDSLLNQKLKDNRDEFLPGMTYVAKWNYPVDKTETVPYSQ